jgi:hypothetical protein
MAHIKLAAARASAEPIRLARRFCCFFPRENRWQRTIPNGPTAAAAALEFNMATPRIWSLAGAAIVVALSIIFAIIRLAVAGELGNPNAVIGSLAGSACGSLLGGLIGAVCGHMIGTAIARKRSNWPN